MYSFTSVIHSLKANKATWCKQWGRTTVDIDRQFIRSVMTVFCLITGPRGRYTTAVIAAEQSRLTTSLITVSLISTITTVLGSVTDLERQSTVEVITLELTRTTVTNRYTAHTHTHTHWANSAFSFWRVGNEYLLKLKSYYLDKRTQQTRQMLSQVVSKTSSLYL